MMGTRASMGFARAAARHLGSSRFAANMSVRGGSFCQNVYVPPMQFRAMSMTSQVSGVEECPDTGMGVQEASVEELMEMVEPSQNYFQRYSAFSVVPRLYAVQEQ
eukprot:TRINITY_DN35904_c0_g1_i1.p1 TRINITY_DN35904_c0_g1~~TRINITY_DN35904_c0_g1_i1.p1  ORF type:complete len:105 (+),score=17.21 TRINITY_DN35904_c0_g1_i1:72-386(+)